MVRSSKSPGQDLNKVAEKDFALSFFEGNDFGIIEKIGKVFASIPNDAKLREVKVMEIDNDNTIAVIQELRVEFDRMHMTGDNHKKLSKYVITATMGRNETGKIIHNHTGRLVDWKVENEKAFSKLLAMPSAA